MAVFTIKSFGGISPRIPPRYLQDNQAQVAINCPVFAGSIQPLNNVGPSLLTLTKVGAPKTIYRYGQDVDSDTEYWFHWTTDVDVCRSQIAGDASEWTFYTGDGTPKATYNALALSGSSYPYVSRPLGLPNPATAPIAALGSYAPAAAGAIAYLSESHIEAIDTDEGIDFSLDGGDTYTNVTIATKTLSAVASALDAETGISAVVDNGYVKVTTTATGADATLELRILTGTTSDTTGTFSYSGYDSTQATGAANTVNFIVVPDTEIGSISSGDVVALYTVVSGTTTNVCQFTSSGTYTASSLASAINSNMALVGGTAAIVATAYGSSVALQPTGAATGTSDGISYTRHTASPITVANRVTNLTATNSESPAPARVVVTQANIDSLEGSYLSTTVNGTEHIAFVYDGSTVNNLSFLVGTGVTVDVYGSIEPVAVVSTNSTGSSTTLRLRGGDYSTTNNYIKITATGTTEEPSPTESRAYVYTYVNKESGFEFESGPSAPSDIVDVHYEQDVYLSSFEGVPTGYSVTHKRIYRTVNGVYLFVAELTIAETNFTDTLKNEELNEELPTATWSPPPANLRGLINLPNGLMAGFVGRDVYFCDPYHPHAWPLNYVQTVDYPVVGLGRMDTTLAVLTTGTPYFIQGSTPDAMVVVKSDLEQSCASKRSIVSTNGVVIYASPDGLVMLTPGGSKLITETMFTRAQWQTYFKPESIHAYQHDLKYVAFYDNGTTSGGFIYDLTSGQIILHDIYAEAGYNDLQRDHLFLAFSDRSVKKWLEGSAKSYTWRSKKFTLPQIGGFSCAQLEAEAYPMTMKFYIDGTLFHTQTVTSRDPFRLPANMGRDIELQVEGSAEVFSLAVAQSMQELTGV